jgi:HD-GYP domain-containing protein (c-di-GMP phosphodiesterase class II)
LAAIVFKSRHGLGFDKDAIQKIVDFTAFFASHFESAVLEKVISQGFLSTIECLALALEAKDYYTIGHSNMVCAYSIAIAREMGLPARTIDEIELGSIMHDIGKIGIDDRILKKEGMLTDEEYEIVKTHPVIGEQILLPLHHNLFQTMRMIIRNHHERMDGEGYPDGLVSAEIPLETKIVICADAFEAMTSHRPYRDALPMDKALEEVQRCKGTQFDPDVADVLCSLMDPKKE